MRQMMTQCKQAAPVLHAATLWLTSLLGQAKREHPQDMPYRKTLVRRTGVGQLAFAGTAPQRTVLCPGKSSQTRSVSSLGKQPHPKTYP